MLIFVPQIYLDGVALLDLPGMLKYVNQPMNRLDHEDSPARSLLLRIKNIQIRNVRLLVVYISSQVFIIITILMIIKNIYRL